MRFILDGRPRHRSYMPSRTGRPAAAFTREGAKPSPFAGGVTPATYGRTISNRTTTRGRRVDDLEYTQQELQMI